MTSGGEKQKKDSEENEEEKFEVSRETFGQKIISKLCPFYEDHMNVKFHSSGQYHCVFFSCARHRMSYKNFQKFFTKKKRRRMKYLFDFANIIFVYGTNELKNRRIPFTRQTYCFFLLASFPMLCVQQIFFVEQVPSKLISGPYYGICGRMIEIRIIEAVIKFQMFFFDLLIWVKLCWWLIRIYRLCRYSYNTCNYVVHQFHRTRKVFNLIKLFFVAVFCLSFNITLTFRPARVGIYVL